MRRGRPAIRVPRLDITPGSGGNWVDRIPAILCAILLLIYILALIFGWHVVGFIPI